MIIFPIDACAADTSMKNDPSLAVRYAPYEKGRKPSGIGGSDDTVPLGLEFEFTFIHPFATTTDPDLISVTREALEYGISVTLAEAVWDTKYYRSVETTRYLAYPE